MVKIQSKQKAGKLAYKMKNRLFSILLLLLFINGCNEKKFEKKHYDNGQLRYTVSILNDKRHGEMIAYFDNGNIKGRSHYVDGKLEGKVISFDIEGNKVSDVTYTDDKKNGYFAQFYIGDNIKEEGWFVEDKPDSVGYYYYESGEVQSRFLSRNGEVIYVKSYNKQGDLISSFLPISVIVQNNIVKVKLEYSEFEEIGIKVIFGRLDNKNNLIDTLDIISSDRMNVQYELKSETKEVSGKLFEIDPQTSEVKGVYHFK